LPVLHRVFFINYQYTEFPLKFNYASLRYEYSIFYNFYFRTYFHQ